MIPDVKAKLLLIGQHLHLALNALYELADGQRHRHNIEPPGLDAADIGSAFLVTPAAMGQRLARAKNKIKVAGIPFRVPERVEGLRRILR